MTVVKPFSVGNNLDEHFPQTRRIHDRNFVKACLLTIYLFCLQENNSLTCYQTEWETSIHI